MDFVVLGSDKVKIKKNKILSDAQMEELVSPVSKNLIHRHFRILFFNRLTAESLGVETNGVDKKTVQAKVFQKAKQLVLHSAVIFAPCVKDIVKLSAQEKLDHLFFLNVFSSDQLRHINYCKPQYAMGSLIHKYVDQDFRSFKKPPFPLHLFTEKDLQKLMASLGYNTVDDYLVKNLPALAPGAA